MQFDIGRAEVRGRLNAIFERTWGGRAGQKPTTEYWDDVIRAIKQKHPDFLFIAEAYWDLEWELQQKGFDFCYDKRLYDRLEHDTAETVRLHLCADLAYQEKLLRLTATDYQKGQNTVTTLLSTVFWPTAPARPISAPYRS